MNEQRIIRPNAGFIILTPRFVDVGLPKASVGACGRYMLIKRDAWGTEIERTPWFDNIILDSGLNRWGTGTIIAGAAIGTGTSTPTASQTNLDTESTYTTASGTGSGVSALGSSPHNNTRTVVYRTVLGALNGNYSEVGVGWASGFMFSRALILDGGGSPTTISVTSAQRLDIFYQLSVYPPLVDIGPTVVTMSGVDYTITGRASSVNSIATNGWQVPTGRIVFGSGSYTTLLSNGTIGAITTTPSGSGQFTFNGTTDDYVNNSLNQTSTSSFALGEGNVSGGATAMSVYWNLAAFQYSLSPAFPKDATKTCSFNFSITWARRP